MRHDTFHWLGQINKASTVMVAATGIVEARAATAAARAVALVIAEGAKAGAERPADYLDLEKRLIAAGGADATRIHVGRSRQDIAATVLRLALRDDLLTAFEALDQTRTGLLTLADRHADAIVPAYTWGVQAQPVSFGHYALAYADALARAGARLREAFARADLSPFGSAALGTSSFPVDRPMLAQLLGFTGVLESSFDATQLAHIDLGAELGGIATGVALTVTTLLADITAQYLHAEPWLRIADRSLTGGSSIMPQKRNPTGVVFLRAEASALIGQAQAFTLMAHNLQSGQSDAKPFIWAAQGEQPNAFVRGSASLLRGLARLVAALELDAARAEAEVDRDWATTTELADVLQREADVPFRVGHHFAAALVEWGRTQRLNPGEVPFAQAQRIYAEAAGEMGDTAAALPIDEATFRRSLSARNMVAAAKGLGGPQAAEVGRMLADRKRALAADDAWIAAVRARMAAADEELDRAFSALL